MDPTAPPFAGRYAFVDLLADGGMGSVWRVWDFREQQFRAAKMLKQSDSGALLRFVRETSWRIDHPNVVMPIGWSAEDDRVLFTMPLIGGGTVSSLIKDFGALPIRWVTELTLQLLAGLEAVHAVGLVHRDVKPSNLLLDPTGTGRPRLRLTDFGIAAPVDEPRMTRVGEVLGTPGYLAPEAAYGADPDPRQDLYSVGVLAYELITGQRPASSGDPSQPTVELAIVQDSALGPFVERMVQLDPRNRYATAAEAGAALRAVRLTPEDQLSDEIEVFDHLPELPPGWTPTGPIAQPAPIAQPGRIAQSAPIGQSAQITGAVQISESAPITRSAPSNRAGTTGRAEPVDTTQPRLPAGQSAGVLPDRPRSIAPVVAAGLIAVGLVLIVLAALLLR